LGNESNTSAHVFLTRQSVGSGPVQPAAQCSLQQSTGSSPLHLPEHCSAQITLVTGFRERRNFRDANRPVSVRYITTAEHSNNN